MSLDVQLLRVLEDLGENELKHFKWFLGQPGILKDFPAIPKSRLERADRLDTVDEMVQMYGAESADVTMRVLSKIGRKDLVHHLAYTSASSKGKTLDGYKKEHLKI